MDPLQGHEYISLITYRENGQPVPTPVWFAQQNNRIYVVTFPAAGKVKRIRHTPRVEVAPCTIDGQLLGSAIEAQARLLDNYEADTAFQLLKRKYSDKPMWHQLEEAHQNSQRVFIEITRKK